MNPNEKYYHRCEKYNIRPLPSNGGADVRFTQKKEVNEVVDEAQAHKHNGRNRHNKYRKRMNHRIARQIEAELAKEKEDARKAKLNKRDPHKK